ncbi:S-adenosyl-L-methionine-binding protein [Fundidesulfovibrio magnetotacticus]|uniref:S-adenosyl-L-methionine-binding protein n=1 Tax=Fundidesulfovibrio magnetotacticus TaxID=2730080 RepID=A0A6V8LRW8_9BACT|nr:TrmO family methyltransferase [Fundidesulfovibrio magnetotacticus]GFK94474.1 S-adenosyl-L-methionine-binding protein [Fundidesulfovibrio magnetotacticus]
MPFVRVPVIGVLRTPHFTLEAIPRQAHLAPQAVGRAELYPEFAPGLKGIAPGDRVVLTFRFHKARRTELTTTTRSTGRVCGVFASRSPRRPSRLGESVVEVTAVEPSALVFRGVDMLDGTPLLDIKPWIGPDRDRG